MEAVVKKQVKLKLVGLDSNSFNLFAKFWSKAKAEGWTEDEIRAVLDECMKGDHHHVIATLMKHCVNGGF
jgi:hypothetical protein